jgi:hypothetical protein
VPTSCFLAIPLLAFLTISLCESSQDIIKGFSKTSVWLQLVCCCVPQGGRAINSGHRHPLQTIVYKGMLRSVAVGAFFKDLKDPRFETGFAIYHRRFSTNTNPKWPLAQPMRILGHNGEINTVQARLAELHLVCLYSGDQS